MPAISSDTLFHFTRSVHDLVSILSKEFCPHYALEDPRHIMGLEDLEIAFPMVCFCDIPLTQATSHMATYGSYAIGLHKTWGVRNGVSPVLYTQDDSPVTETLRSVFDQALAATKKKGHKIDEIPQLGWDFLRLSWYTKRYEGPFIRQGRVIPQVRFYDEREWRWLPREIAKVRPLAKSEYLDFGELAKANGALRCEPLHFEPSDIKYIIVATESELLPMIRQVRAIKEKYSEDEKALLCSRIMSAEQIVRDF